MIPVLAWRNAAGKRNQGVCPQSEFAGKRTVVHRDGSFRGGEKVALCTWARYINATFFLVEGIKSGVPRLYGVAGGQTTQPAKGSVFKINETEALLVSSLPPFGDAPPHPLRVQTELPFRIEKVIHSILSLTLLHYGSVRPPRLPITIYESDQIAYLAIHGIKPKESDGSSLFWLEVCRQEGSAP